MPSHARPAESSSDVQAKARSESSARAFESMHFLPRPKMKRAAPSAAPSRVSRRSFMSRATSV